MARPLRDQSAGIRHVICRGNRGQPIFADDVDRERFLRLLAVVAEKLHWRVLAYCLMTNHVHLLLLVPEATISRGLQRLSGGHAQAFNLRHGYRGHLFEGRFKAVVVEDESHALEELRYIPNNPCRAGIARDATDVDWRWSSHRQILGLEPALPFLDVTWTLGLFRDDPAQASRAYARFVREGALRQRERRRATRLLDKAPSAGPRRPTRSPLQPGPRATRALRTRVSGVPIAAAPLPPPDLSDMSRGQTPGRVPPGRVPDD